MGKLIGPDLGRTSTERQRLHKKSFNPGSQPSHAKRIDHVLSVAWRASTSKQYKSAVAQFWTFCDSEGVPTSARLPAEEFVLAAFASQLAGNMAGATIRGKFSALRAWHIRHNMQWNGGTRLSYILRGADRLTPATSHQNQRPPITAAMLDMLATDLDNGDPLDAVVLFTAYASFWGQLRLGELLASTEHHREIGRVPGVQDLGPPNALGSRTLRLPVTKTGSALGEQVILCRQQTSIDPIRALSNHLWVNAVAVKEPAAPLCSYVCPWRGRLALTRRRFLKRCNDIWVKRGLPVSTGHEFRIGGTTHLLLSGVPPDIVKVLGRWSSDSFLRYWRSLEIIACKYIEGLPRM